MDKNSLLQALQGAVPGLAEYVPADPKFVRGGDELQVKIPADQVEPMARHLKNIQGFDFLNFLTAVDYIKENRFELIYHFFNSAAPVQEIFVRVDLPRSGEPQVASLTPLYPAADWQERETFDLFGIRFQGHPDLRRILLWEGYPGWPLRKDYVHTPDRFDNGSEIGLPKVTGAAS